ncbi:hypothetical protein BJ138DRAFT_1143761 [Hygrophoropsis aurantiaca]|uniref:Uncharacterized protein n=1 Tax=Hygrophoropsis aurantiaca TaxID=72124 RepID=A0ACB8APF3_9AGAM|nr:hypothetical protein BJ138DRAFT_1143761 [Hygrophoropsis aurantiaca]
MASTSRIVISDSQDTIVNSTADLSPAHTLSDLADVAPEDYEDCYYYSMPHSLRRVLTPPQELDECPTRGRSVLFDSPSPPVPPSPGTCFYGRPRWSPASEHGSHFPLHRARQSVSSIGSCSTVQTKAAPVRSILTRHDSGVSMATKSSRKKKGSPPSVKFVESPTVHYADSGYGSPPRSPPGTSRRKLRFNRLFTRWWKSPPSSPKRPTISGPYHLSYASSLVDVYSIRSSKTEHGRFRQFWRRVTNSIR